jgi:hypothetical protein
MAGSSQPSHREQGAKGEATAHPRVGRSRRVGGRTDAMTVVAVTQATQCQHSAGTAATLPLAAADEAMLVAAR